MEIKILGVTSDVTTCTCCGKENLKKTIAFYKEGEIEPNYYGVNCFQDFAKLNPNKKYTAKNAETIISDYNRREEKRKIIREYEERAQAQSKEDKKNYYVIQHNDRSYSVIDDRFYNHLIENIGIHPNIIFRALYKV